MREFNATWTTTTTTTATNEALAAFSVRVTATFWRRRDTELRSISVSVYRLRRPATRWVFRRGSWWEGWRCDARTRRSRIVFVTKSQSQWTLRFWTHTHTYVHVCTTVARSGMQRWRRCMHVCLLVIYYSTLNTLTILLWLLRYPTAP